MDAIPLLQSYQTLLVGLIGFGGVIITMICNAHIGRNARKETIQHEREALRAALIEELKIINNACEKNSEACANPPNKSTSAFIDVPTHEFSDVYRALINKIGLLNADEISTVMRAYLTYRHFLHVVTLRLSVPDMPSGQIRVPNSKASELRGLYESVTPTVWKAIQLLESSKA